MQELSFAENLNNAIQQVKCHDLIILCGEKWDLTLIGSLRKQVATCKENIQYMIPVQLFEIKE